MNTFQNDGKDDAGMEDFDDETVVVRTTLLRLVTIICSSFPLLTDFAQSIGKYDSPCRNRYEYSYILHVGFVGRRQR